MFGKHTSCSGTSNVDVKLTLDLTDYVKTEDLTVYVTTEDLGNYVTAEDLTDYVTTEDLSDYLTSTTAASTYAPQATPTFTGTSTFNGPVEINVNNNQMAYVNNLGLYNNFYFYQNAESTFAGTITANDGIVAENAITNNSTLHQGGEATFLSSIKSTTAQNQIKIQSVNNFWYLSAPAYSTQNTTNKLTLWPGYTANNFQEQAFEFYQNGNFYVPGVMNANNGIYSKGMTNEGTMYQIGTTNFEGDITLNNSMNPNYQNLPSFTIDQIGGFIELDLPNGTYLTGYSYSSYQLPKGYYLVIANLDVTPAQSSGTIYYGVSPYDYFNTSNPYKKYWSFSGSHTNGFIFTFYITNTTVRDYQFFIYTSITVTVASAKCTFIRIA